MITCLRLSFQYILGEITIMEITIIHHYFESTEMMKTLLMKTFITIISSITKRRYVHRYIEKWY
jgi:hypothetical protein